MLDLRCAWSRRQKKKKTGAVREASERANERLTAEHPRSRAAHGGLMRLLSVRGKKRRRETKQCSYVRML